MKLVHSDVTAPAGAAARDSYGSTGTVEVLRDRDKVAKRPPAGGSCGPARCPTGCLDSPCTMRRCPPSPRVLAPLARDPGGPTAACPREQPARPTWCRALYKFGLNDSSLRTFPVPVCPALAQPDDGKGRSQPVNVARRSARHGRSAQETARRTLTARAIGEGGHIAWRNQARVCTTRSITSRTAPTYALPNGRSCLSPVAAACSAGSNGMTTSGCRSARA